MAFERTISLDPRNVPALVGLAIIEFNEKEASSNFPNFGYTYD